MLEPKEVLRAKLERLSEEKDIAFFVTLLTCGGRSPTWYGHPEGFASYIGKYGESTFDAVRDTLVRAGVVVESPGALTINHPDFSGTSYEQQKELAGELGETV